MKETLYNTFTGLFFEEESHTYTLNGEVLPSVSSLIKKHETFVDFKAISKAVAIRDNKSQSQVIEEWDKIKNDACALGTATHNYAEFYDGTQEPQNILQEAARKFFNTLPTHFEILCKELRMFSKEFKYAGTADLILLDKRNNNLWITDFKTNKDLWKSYQMLQPPFENLEQNNFNKYQFQLSYYQIMLEQSGYKVESRAIIWLQRNGEFSIHQTKDYTKELKNFLSNRN